MTTCNFDDSPDWIWPPPTVMVGGCAAFVRATGALAQSASSGHLVLQGIGMRVVPPPLCDRANFRQLLTVDVASNSITALPFGIFMWLLQLQNMILDHNNITAFPFCLLPVHCRDVAVFCRSGWRTLPLPSDHLQRVVVIGEHR